MEDIYDSVLALFQGMFAVDLVKYTILAVAVFTCTVFIFKQLLCGGKND